MRLELYRETRVNVNGEGSPLEGFYEPGGWRWRFVSSNGRVMADSGQAYSRRKDCLDGACLVLGGWVHDLSGGSTEVRRPPNVHGEFADVIQIRDLEAER